MSESMIKILAAMIISIVVFLMFLMTAYTVNWFLARKYGEGPFDIIFYLGHPPVQEKPAQEPTPETSEEQSYNYKFMTENG